VFNMPRVLPYREIKARDTSASFLTKALLFFYIFFFHYPMIEFTPLLCGLSSVSRSLLLQQIKVEK
jgi:hypothetical protein